MTAPSLLLPFSLSSSSPPATIYFSSSRKRRDSEGETTLNERIAMVGLSVVLENQKNGSIISTRKPTQVINKTTMLASPSVCRNSSVKNFSVPAAFLDYCFLCRQKLLPGKDIYMYKGDRAFCSVECRCRQIFMDEEETIKKENCSWAAMKPSPQTPAESASPSTSSSSSSASRNRRAERNRGVGVGFAC